LAKEIKREIFGLQKQLRVSPTSMERAFMEDMLSFNELHAHSMGYIYCFRFGGVEKIRYEQVEQQEIREISTILP